jgi:nucleoside-diphosphate-sugar epimerase
MVKSALDNGLVRIKNLHLRRSILGINDVARAIMGAIDCTLGSGFYNLSSFTSTVREMGLLVADKLKAKIDILEDDKTYYDYEINSDKFASAINFKFLETAESIIDDLVNQHNSVVYDTRDDDRTDGVF